MKILSITAGAGGMYCGSCFRDNTLAAELIAQGHEVLLLPLYTPTLTDERNVSQRRVFFGGISIYLQQHFALFRNTPWLLDRLWDSSFVLRMASRRAIRTDPHRLGELTVSMLRGEDGNQRKELDKLLAWLDRKAPPDVVNLPNSLLIGLAHPIKKILGRPVCCTLQGEELFIEGVQEPYRRQALDLIRASVGHVDAFLAVSDYCARFMSEYLGIPMGKMRVVPLGVNVEGYAFVPRPPGVFTIGYFARVIPEKGLHLLCEAYRRLRRHKGAPPARLEVAGYLGPEHRGYLRDIERQIKDWGLAQEFHYRGVLDRPGKIAFLQSLDVLSVPATYAEPKGMFALEAMAGGVPVVQPRSGAFPEIIEKIGGGILFEPNNPDSLADSLLALATDTALAERLRRSAWEGVRRHYSAAHMAARAVEVYTALRTTGDTGESRRGKTVPRRSSMPC